MVDDDFLWECANMIKPRNDTTWLVPDERELKQSDSIEKYELKSMKVHKMPLTSGNIQVYTNEIREFGILDTIGGEVWEAAYLLCAHILLHESDKFVKRSVLELGCGVGLPGMLLADLKRRSCTAIIGDIYLTDFDHRILDNVEQSVNHQFQQVEEGTEADGSFGIHVQSLDWLDFSNPCRGEVVLCEHIIGAALCYSPCHAALADTIKCHLDAGCSEVTIIQMPERAGFAEFLRRLEHLNVSFTLEEIAGDVYALASEFVVTSSANPKAPTSPDGASGVPKCIEISLASIDKYRQQQEKVVQGEQGAQSPPPPTLQSLCNTVHGADTVVGENDNNGDDDYDDEHGASVYQRRPLAGHLKTERSAFALLTIRAQGSQSP